MSVFQFKQFQIQQDRCAMKVGTDGVLLGAWVSVLDRKIALDIGAGTGLISLMLAQRNLNLNIKAVEIDPMATDQCKENFEKSPWSIRLQVNFSSFQDFTLSGVKGFDLIVCNPPYFQVGLKSESAQRNLARHAKTLNGNELFSGADTIASGNCILGLIIPSSIVEKYIICASRYNWYPTRITQVITAIGKPPARTLLEFGRQKIKFPEENYLVIENGGRNVWSEEYKSLTKEFYLRL